MTEAGQARELVGGMARRRGPLSARVAFVRDLAERITAVGDLDELGKVVRDEVCRGLGVSAVVLTVVSEDAEQLTTVVAEGVSKEAAALLAIPGTSAEHRAVVDALTRGVPVLWPSLAVRDRDVPVLAALPSKAKSWAVLPLLSRSKTVGALSLGWSAPRRFGRVEVAFLELIALQCALAVDRARAEEVRRAERDALELLSEGTRLMVSALDPGRVLDELVHLAVPRLAPWCAVYVAESGTLRRAGVEVAGEPALVTALRADGDVPAGSAGPVADAYRSGTARVVHPIAAGVLAGGDATKALRDDVARLLAGSGPWTGYFLPVRSFGTVIGVMALASPGWGLVPPDRVRFTAEGLAGRAGVAIVNARRFQDERATAALLMEAFLPAELPRIPGYEVAARYLPAGAKVAGDWYDVARLPDGRYLVGIGDAGGHGIEAASLMGQLRNCARGLAMTGHTPAQIIEALHLLTAENGPESFATAAYGVLDLADDSLRWCAAGHLPPLEFSDGTARYVEGPVSPPLGWPAAEVGELRASLASGSGTVLFTDGLVERRDQGVEVGMHALRELVAAHGALGADALSRLIADRLAPGAHDDCCVVVLRRR